MATYYLDTSALIKRYITEQGSAWMRQLFLQTNRLIIGRLTQPETVSALTRRMRGGTLSQTDQTRLINLFNFHLAKRFWVVEIDATLCNHAANLAQTYGLRGYDSVQLACGVYAHHLMQLAGGQGLTFLSADKNLLKVCQLEGIPDDNPDLH